MERRKNNRLDAVRAASRDKPSGLFNIKDRNNLPEQRFMKPPAS
jgi:hypothetical protein